MALLRRGVTLVMFAALAVASADKAGEASPVALSAAQAKAGFLFNCAMFVAWPAEAISSGEIVIGVVGEDPVSAVIREMQGRQVNGRVLRIRSLRPQDDVAGHHVLFVAGDDSRSAKSVLTRIGDASILTVGEHDDFTASGGVVRLHTEQGRLRFEINMTRAEGAGLKVSAKMLGLAKIVR